MLMRVPGLTPLWARRVNPIPACNCDQGFGCSSTPDQDMHKPYRNGSSPVPTGYKCPTGTMFPVPFDYGYGHQMWTIDNEGPASPTWMIVDQVRAPEQAGSYVLRWRWDTEQNVSHPCCAAAAARRGTNLRAAMGRAKYGRTAQM